jgi:processing peptidase subunit alpha
LLAETILESTYPDEDIEDTKAIIQWQSAELAGNILSKDAVIVAAYQHSPLGNHHYCPADLLESRSVSIIKEFKKQQFFGDNCLIAGAGINHEYLVKLVESKFGTLPKSSPLYVKRPVSRYTGGMYKNQRELKEPFTRVSLGFEIGGWHDANLVPLCVLQMLLGGGSSFSAGM